MPVIISHEISEVVKNLIGRRKLKNRHPDENACVTT